MLSNEKFTADVKNRATVRTPSIFIDIRLEIIVYSPIVIRAWRISLGVWLENWRLLYLKAAHILPSSSTVRTYWRNRGVFTYFLLVRKSLLWYTLVHFCCNFQFILQSIHTKRILKPNLDHKLWHDIRKGKILFER